MLLLETVTGIANRFSVSLCGNYRCHYKPLRSIGRALNCQGMDVVGNMDDVNARAYCLN